MLIPILDFVGLMLVAAGLWLAWISYPQLPEQIPIHFNFRGEPDSWAGKGSIWLLPVLAAVVFVMNLGLTRLPMPPRTELMVMLLSAEMAGMFLWLLWSQIQVARGERARLGNELWALVAVVVATPLLLRV